LTKDNEAIESLKRAINEIQKLNLSYPFSSEHIKWVSDTLFLLEEIFGRRSRIFLTFQNFSWQPSGSYVTSIVFAQQELENIKKMAYLQQLESAKGILESGIEQIRRKGVEKVYEGKNTPPESSEILKIMSLIDNRLRKVIRDIPLKEKEIQDALDNLFIGAGLDGQYTREIEAIPFSSKSYKPDFIFPKIDTIVELKLCKSKENEKEIISQINDDILAYKTKFANLIFIIYDIGIIRNQDQFKTHLENDQVVIKVIKH
jgi:hypothetical protein